MYFCEEKKAERVVRWLLVAAYYVSNGRVPIDSEAADNVATIANDHG
jgi:hypothetical protein